MALAHNSFLVDMLMLISRRRTMMHSLEHLFHRDTGPGMHIVVCSSLLSLAGCIQACQIQCHIFHFFPFLRSVLLGVVIATGYHCCYCLSLSLYPASPSDRCLLESIQHLPLVEAWDCQRTGKLLLGA